MPQTAVTHMSIRRKGGCHFAWRYDLEHGVTPAGPEREVDWSADDGLWLMALEWTEAHPLSKAK